MAKKKKGTDTTSSLFNSDQIMREIKKKTDKFQLQELPAPTLEQMDRELAERQREIVINARELEMKLEKELEAGKGLIVSEIRSTIRRLHKEHRELGGQRAKVYDARQHRILEDGMIRVLGSKKRVKFLEWFILTLIVGVVGMLIYDLAHPELDDETKVLISLIDVGACLIFLSEFFFRHRYAESKRWFWRRHWIDFVTSIPLPHIPQAQMARFGRLARLARLTRLMRLARLLRILRVIFFFWRGMDKLQDVLDVKMMKRSIAITVMILLAGAALIWFAESQNPNAEGVNSFGESVWWSFTTVVTGGFGDIHNPQTVWGRLVTVILIIAGMIVVGIFIATLTSVLVGDESELLLANQKELSEKLDRVVEMMERMAEREGVILGESKEKERDS